MKVQAFVHNYQSGYSVAYATLAGLQISAEGDGEPAALQALAFKILDHTEPKFVELDLEAYARACPNRNAPPAPPVLPEPDEHPIELARRAQGMRASGLTDEQIAAKIGGVSIVFVQNLIATLEKLSPAMIKRIQPPNR